MSERNQGSRHILNDTLVIIPVNESNQAGISTALLTVNGKPLVFNAIDIAQQLAPNVEICLSSNDMNLIQKVTDYGLNVPFKLPHQLSTNVLDIDEIILHAIDHYARKEINFDEIVMLSPYSPFCQPKHIQEATSLLTEDTEMVASVKELNGVDSQYYLTENQEGYIEKHADKSSLNGATLYKYNKAFCILKTSAIRQYPRAFFSRIRKYLMSDKASVFIHNSDDIDRLS